MNEDRREEVLRHGIALVRESGIGGLTMKKVAARVGFTETAAYRYFPSKQALLVGIARELGRRLLGPARALAASEEPAQQRLEAIVRHHVDFVLDLDGLPMLLLVEGAAQGDRDLLGALKETVGAYVELLAGVVAQARPGIAAVRPEDVALALVGVPATLAIRRRIGADPAAERRARDELLPFLIARLTAP